MIKVLDSGSKGNCYIVQADEETLIIELGITFKEILKGLNFDLKNIVGCLVTHAHSDHARSLKDALKYNLNIYCNSEVAETVEHNRRINIIKPLKKFKVGNFTILPFDCQHANNDGSKCENTGFLIYHKSLGKVLFATDTYYLKYNFRDLNHILIECNYDEEELDNLPSYRSRILKSHMSLQTLKATLKAWNLEKTKNITLIHLSNSNANPEKLKEEIQKSTGCIVNIAKENLLIE